MGMNAITSDMAKQRRALQSSFLEAESAAACRLTEVEAVRSAVESTCHTKLRIPSDQTHEQVHSVPEDHALACGPCMGWSDLCFPDMLVDGFIKDKPQGH
jgi:hypothetical protein